MIAVMETLLTVILIPVIRADVQAEIQEMTVSRGEFQLIIKQLDRIERRLENQ